MTDSPADRLKALRVKRFETAKDAAEAFGWNEMTFRSIGDLAIEVLAEIDGMENREGTGALDLTVPPQRDRERHVRMGKKNGGATELNPTKLPPSWEVWTNSGVRKYGRAVAAANGKPHPAARLYVVTVNGVRVHYEALSANQSRRSSRKSWSR